jgi:hypothetical protein
MVAIPLTGDAPLKQVGLQAKFDGDGQKIG